MRPGQPMWPVYKRLRWLHWLHGKMNAARSGTLCNVVVSSALISAATLYYMVIIDSRWASLLWFLGFAVAFFVMNKSLTILQFRGEYYEADLYKANHPDDTPEP